MPGGSAGHLRVLPRRILSREPGKVIRLKNRLTRRRLLAAMAIGFAYPLLGACSSGGGDARSSAGSCAVAECDDTIEVDLFLQVTGTSSGGFRFEPDTIEIEAAKETTLFFVNTSSAPHSFTIDGVVDTGVVQHTGAQPPADSNKFVTFTAPAGPGELVFYCTVHGAEAESGAVIVTWTR
jgi:plastocyanin